MKIRQKPTIIDKKVNEEAARFKETKKILKEIENERERKLKQVRKDYEKEIKQVAGDRADLKHAEVWGKEKVADIEDVRFWTLINVEALKDFIKYGSNKVLDGIRVRTHANILAREEIERAKKKQGGIDTKYAIVIIAMVGISAIAGYMILNNYFNANGIADMLQQEKASHGNTMGQLAVCQTQLEYYQPGGIARPINATGVLHG